MTEEEFLRRMKKEILDTDDDITLETKLATLDTWDSLSLVSFIAMATIATGKRPEAATIQAAETVGDLYRPLA